MMRRRRSAIGLVLALALAACGGARQNVPVTVATTAATAHGALNALAQTFSAWDEQHQAELVAAATSKEEGAAQLAAYRGKRQAVYRAFAGAYTAIIAVAAVMPLAELHPERGADLVALLTKSVAAVADVQVALDALIGGP